MTIRLALLLTATTITVTSCDFIRAWVFNLPLTSCARVLAVFPDSETALYVIDIDGSGAEEAFDTICDMSTDGGGWTLVGIVSGADGDSWTDYDVWSDSSEFGDPESGDDYKNIAWSTLEFDQIFLKGSGTKITTAGDFGAASFADLMSTSTRLSLDGTESGWEYNNGTLEIVDDKEFFGEIQNPPNTLDFNLSNRNGCVLATAFDGWFADDSVQGFGCAGGVGPNVCDDTDITTCGDVIVESILEIYVR